MLIGVVFVDYISENTATRLIIGSWCNPSLLLVPAVSPPAIKTLWLKALSTVSFVITTSAYVSLCQEYFYSK
jgi:hypothetical protein